MPGDDSATARQLFGEALFELRQGRGYTFTQLQNACGILVAQQEGWENGVELPSPYDLTTILRELDPGPPRIRSIQALYKKARELTETAEEREAFELLARNQAQTSGDDESRGTADRSPKSDQLRRWFESVPAEPGAPRRAGRGGIFISYRRTDSAHVAARLYDRLAATFTEDQTFMDVDTIQPGVDFTKAIEVAVRQARVMLVLIGPGWTSAVDADGRRRLRDPDDFVRAEIVAALKSGLRIIPILVDGTPMPGSNELPPELAELASFQAIHLGHQTFSSDVNLLVDVLARLLGAP